jgi:hypothetical protein
MTTRSAVLGAGVLDDIGYWVLFTCPPGFTTLWKAYAVASTVESPMQVTLFVWGPSSRRAMDNAVQDAEPEIVPVPAELNVPVAKIDLPEVLSHEMAQLWLVLEPGMRIGASVSHPGMHYLVVGAALLGTSPMVPLRQGPVYLGRTKPA